MIFVDLCNSCSSLFMLRGLFFVIFIFIYVLVHYFNVMEMSDLEGTQIKGEILVVGGGISGITAAVEAADCGYKVLLAEKNPYLGGRVAQINQYFPKLCHPYCGLEINFRRIRQNSQIRYFTLAEIENISGHLGNFDVTVKVQPRYVNEKCTACNQCVEVCPLERPNEFNYGLDKTKAIYLPHELALPMRYVIDDKVCPGTECASCVAACRYDAIDLSMKPKSFTAKVGSVILATGWKPYDATKLDNLGFGNYKNVITNVMLERLAAPNGPTKGKIVRPSDGKEVNNVAFVQCAGSRDENHLPYCSAVCCLASLKQVTYMREQNPHSKVYIFYIDVRAKGTLEDFYVKVQKEENVTLIKGKVAKITEDPEKKDLVVEAEDILSGRKIRVKTALVVLATGIVPTTGEWKIPTDIPCDEYGFIASDSKDRGIIAAGCAKSPADVATSVQDATAAALKAIQCVVMSDVNVQAIS